MKLYVIILIMALPMLWGCSQSQESKAQKLVKQHLKETLNDFDSYSSVSYSKLDSLKTEWRLPEELREDSKGLTETADKLNALGYSITTHENANERLKELDEIIAYSIEKKDPDTELAKKRNIQKQLWLEYKQHQDVIKDSYNKFVPQFTGWKITHTYRAKNKYNATILVSQEFSFDKDITQITDVQDN